MFETFEHKADVGVRGIGRTMENAFEECALGMVSVMIELDLINPKKSHVIKISARDEETLLINFLNELLYLKDAKKMVYSRYRVRIKKENKPIKENTEEIKKENKNNSKKNIKITNKNGQNNFFLSATCFGEKIDLNKHEFLVDVKAATYSELKVKQLTKNKWVAQCIIDV